MGDGTAERAYYYIYGACRRAYKVRLQTIGVFISGLASFGLP